MNTAEALELVAARDRRRLAALEAERDQPPVPPMPPRRLIREILLLVHKASTGGGPSRS